MIVIERNAWEPGVRYYFRSNHGATPICELTQKGDHWEVLFYRGATHPGPHVYFDFEKAKRHILRYVGPREAELQGELALWAKAGLSIFAGGEAPPRSRTDTADAEPSRPSAKRRTRRRYH